jgi:tetratricopeptide (TPR) repeat protein
MSRPMSRRPTVFRALMASSLVLAVPLTQAVREPAARAQPAKPAPGAKKKLAKQYVDSGLAAQDAGDYDTALSLYGKAYELVPHPALLFNMAQVHRLAGRLEAAVDLYGQYLASEPSGPMAKTSRELLTALEAQLAADAQKAREAEQAAQRKAEEARKAEAAPNAAASAPAAPAASRPSPPTDATPSSVDDGGSRGRTLRIAGLVAGGVGLVGLGAGVAFNLRASSLSDDLSRPGNPYDPGKKSDGESAERMMYLSFAAGGALLIGGAAMYFLGHRARNERVALAPSFSLDSVGLVVIGGLP